jgi:hypothetical protein
MMNAFPPACDVTYCELRTLSHHKPAAPKLLAVRGEDEMGELWG